MSDCNAPETCDSENAVSVGKDRLSIKRIFSASIEKLFACFTQPELLSQWHAPGTMSTPLVEVDLKVTGRYRIAMQNDEGQTFTATGSYKEITPPNKLVYTWAWEGKDSGETLVTVLFTEMGDQTEVELIHEGFAVTDEAQHHSMGWKNIFINLAKHLEN